MKTWTAAIALFAASTMLVGSALAQATSPGDQSKDKAKGGSSMPSSSPAASGSSSTDSTKSDSSATKSDAGKTDMKASDATKSDTKSDTMKSAKHGKGKGDMARAGGNTEQLRAAQQRRLGVAEDGCRQLVEHRRGGSAAWRDRHQGRREEDRGGEVARSPRS